MICQHQIRINNPNYGKIVGEEPYIFVPCGKCFVCKYNDSLAWKTRLLEENRVAFNSFFITLTYAPDKRPSKSVALYNGQSMVYNPVSKKDCQNFIKRFRANCERKYNFDLSTYKYFLVSEYTPTHLFPHYHAIFFNIGGVSPRSYKTILKLREAIRESWSNGNITCDVCEDACISYVCKYLTMFQELPDYFAKPFRLMSRRPAIGISYFDREQLINWHKDNLALYVPRGTFKDKMPRYYKEHIFDEDEKKRIREKLLALPPYYLRDVDKIGIALDYLKDVDDLDTAMLELQRYRYKKFEDDMRKKYFKSRKI